VVDVNTTVSTHREIVERMPLAMAKRPRDPEGVPVPKTLWRGMVRRCHDPSATGYQNYGARGVSVCERWCSSYTTFVADLPPRLSQQHALDRIDNDGDYEPDNVRWSTRAEQARNTRVNRVLVVGGEARTLEDWAARTGIAKSTLFNRIGRGWSDERVVTTPVQAKADDNSLFPVGGREKCVELGLNVYTVASRLRRGWSFDRAINEPARNAR